MLSNVRLTGLSCSLLLLALACEEERPAPAAEREVQRAETELDSDGIDSMGDPVDNEDGCPGREPEEGGACDDSSLVCKYGPDPDCRSRWVCTEDKAWSLDFAMRDCGEGCPEEEPANGDPCEVDRAQCTYGPSPVCRSLWLCWEHEWSEIVPARDCDAVVECPDDAPETGDACSPEEATPNGELCVYSGAIRCSCSCSWGPPDEQWEEPEAAWTCTVISAEFDPEYLTGCPAVAPKEGSQCSTENSCGYRGPEECEGPGAGASLAQCIGGEWTYLEDN